MFKKNIKQRLMIYNSICLKKINYNVAIKYNGICLFVVNVIQTN